jgi:hypothetical protein
LISRLLIANETVEHTLKSIAELEQNLKLKIRASVAEAAQKLGLQPVNDALAARISDYGMEALLECTCSARDRALSSTERGLLHYFAVVELKKTIAYDHMERTQLEAVAY